VDAAGSGNATLRGLESMIMAAFGTVRSRIVPRATPMRPALPPDHTEPLEVIV
jgi:hypothetical protein